MSVTSLPKTFGAKGVHGSLFKNTTNHFRIQKQFEIRPIFSSKPLRFPITDATAKLVNEIIEGKRSSLARAITLGITCSYQLETNSSVESSLPEHQVQAGFLLSAILQKQKEKPSRYKMPSHLI